MRPGKRKQSVARAKMLGLQPIGLRRAYNFRVVGDIIGIICGANPSETKCGSEWRIH